MSVVLAALGVSAVVTMSAFALVMYLGWRRVERDLIKAQGQRNRRRPQRVLDPQIDEDQHIQAVRRRMQERS